MGRNAIVAVTLIRVLLLGAWDASAQTPRGQSPAKPPPVVDLPKPSAALPPIAQAAVSADKTLQFWSRTHQSPSVAFVFTDPLIIYYKDGTDLNQFDQFAAILRKASAELLKVSTVGVHPDLVEWNIKACLLLELRAISFEVYSRNFKRYVNPLGGFNMAADSFTDFLKELSKGDSAKSAAARSMLGTFTKSIDEVGNAYQAVRKAGQEVAREKYVVRGRVSNQLGVELPLDDDGCPVVRHAIPGSPAEKVGLQPGDIMISYDGKSLAKESFTVNALADAVEQGRTKSSCTFRLRRAGDIIELQVPPGRLGFEYLPAPANLPTPWDDRFYMRPKGWTDSYPMEKTQRDKWR